MAQVCDNHLDSKCIACQNVMQIPEGTVCGKKWYHQKCYDELSDKKWSK